MSVDANSKLRGNMSNLKTPTRFDGDFTWTIHDFKVSACYGGFRDDDEYVAKSSYFSVAKDTYEWFLELRTDTKSDPSRTTRLFLEIVDRTEIEKDERGPISGKYEFSLIDSEGRKVHTDSRYFRLGSKEDFFQIQSFPRDEACLFESDCIYENKLRIYCKVSYIYETEVNYFSFIDQPHSFQKDFEKLLNDEEFSDVAVFVGNKKFPCHKNILAARCPVFKAMLTHDMKENRSNRIEIHDLDENIFQEVLRYIYTDKVEISETTVLELLHAADQYDLAMLRTMCETELSKTLTVQNAVKVLSISKTYNLENLRSKATEFIQTNLKIISSTNAWNDLIKHPDLVISVLEAFAK